MHKWLHDDAQPAARSIRVHAAICRHSRQFKPLRNNAVDYNQSQL